MHVDAGIKPYNVSCEYDYTVYTTLLYVSLATSTQSDTPTETEQRQTYQRVIFENNFTLITFFCNSMSILLDNGEAYPSLVLATFITYLVQSHGLTVSTIWLCFLPVHWVRWPTSERSSRLGV